MAAGDSGIIDSLRVAVEYTVDKASEARARAGFDEIAAGALAAAAAITALAVATAENTAEQGYQAEALGLTVEEYTRLGYVAESARVPIDNLQGGLRQLTQQLGQAAMGAEGPLDLFRRLGINVRDAAGEVRPAAEVLADIGDRMDDVRLKGTGASIALQLLGDDGARLRPLLDLGGDAIRDLGKRADLLGATIDGEAVEAAERLTGSLGDLRVLGGGLTRRLTADVIPALADVTEGTVEWYLANKSLLDARLDLVADGLGASFQAASTPLGALVTAGVAVIGGKAGWEQLVKAAGSYGPALSSAGATAGKLAMRGGALALLALVLEDVYSATTTGEGAIIDLFAAFGAGEEASTVLMAFGDATSASLDIIAASASLAAEAIRDLFAAIDVDWPDIELPDLGLPSAEAIAEWLGRGASGLRAGASAIRADVETRQLSRAMSERSEAIYGAPISVTVQAPADADAIAREAGRAVERQVRDSLATAREYE